jgi:signal transduction histidine kinase
VRGLPRTLRGRLLAAFVLPTLAFILVAGAVGYSVSRGVLEEELGRSLCAIAASAASQVSGERLLMVEPGDDVAETRTYRNLLRVLEDVRGAAGMRRVFAVDTERKVRLDAGGGLPVGTEMPELLRDGEELEQVFGGKATASQVLFEGNDGLLYKTGYAPLLENGRVVGAVGVEGSALFFSPLRQLFRGFALWALLALALLAGVALFTAEAFARPLRRLMSAALRMGRGDLSTPVPPEEVEEIGVLAHELEEMRGALESRDRQLKMMLAGVAHEVRNPIGGIELFAGLLREELPRDAEAFSHVTRILQEIDYLKRMVEDFLAFARESTLARAPLEATAWVSRASELLRLEAANRTVRFELDIQPGALEADESLLTGALVNLLKNALQASPPGGAVRVRAAPQGERYVLRLSDEGPGITPDLGERIFEPFFTTREKGTGLGLPLARKVLRAHGGDLTLEPTGAGANFSMWLPLKSV